MNTRVHARADYIPGALCGSRESLFLRDRETFRQLITVDSGRIACRRCRTLLTLERTRARVLANAQAKKATAA
jgi:hypothetical protein